MSCHQALMKSRPEMTVGALHNVQLPQSDPTTTPNRVYPCTQNENHPFSPDIERYKTFVVVLDKPNFVEEASVLFVMTDGGKMKTNPRDEYGMLPKENCFETQVWRSAGMPEVARRLGTVFLKRNVEVLEEDAATGSS